MRLVGTCILGRWVAGGTCPGSKQCLGPWLAALWLFTSSSLEFPPEGTEKKAAVGPHSKCWGLGKPSRKNSTTQMS